VDERRVCEAVGQIRRRYADTGPAFDAAVGGCCRQSVAGVALRCDRARECEHEAAGVELPGDCGGGP
jgi:hypothetical protein